MRQVAPELNGAAANLGRIWREECDSQVLVQVQTKYVCRTLVFHCGKHAVRPLWIVLSDPKAKAPELLAQIAVRKSV